MTRLKFESAFKTTQIPRFRDHFSHRWSHLPARIWTGLAQAAAKQQLTKYYCHTARVVTGIQETSEARRRREAATRASDEEGRVREVEEPAEAELCHLQAFRIRRRRDRGQYTLVVVSTVVADWNGKQYSAEAADGLQYHLRWAQMSHALNLKKQMEYTQFNRIICSLFKTKWCSAVRHWIAKKLITASW